MARQGTGDKGQPTYDSNNPPDDAADLTELGQYAADVGNTRAGTTAQRNTFTNSGLAWEGLAWHDTTLKATLVFTAGLWQRRGGVAPRVDLVGGRAQSVPNGTAATVRWASYTASGGFVRQLNGIGDAFIAPLRGLYAASGSGIFDGAMGGSRRMTAIAGGRPVSSTPYFTRASDTATLPVGAAAPIFFADAGDVIYFQLVQNRTDNTQASLNFTADPVGMIAFVSPA
ncbi:hypothetical protein [Frondihabitans sp. VKM Ac-2883]|uniref:hypothetical protein n=1 Tax=Frondihabitans sp. VKM Ac-2883 TaxID=2783823 RepID=UPI00188CA87B|nr:hypothetical protein [Frondihabitans sp. VKM Ac-2883]MBF4574667.1 hypothetical protein [Frondihabitans sp. VKM Ac-2883]